ncbi:MAG: uroporphyrinogen-III C-methyltransferase [Bacteroidetes bacterium]|nr:uroporphyrinogen-III C-methyltransferase [Bacteroidota bacterium]
MVKKLSTPKVILAGAGPGDPDLITVKTLRYLKAADVLIVDRLVDQSLLSHAKLGAKIYFVGKEGGNPCSFTQESINLLLVEESKLGRLVLRLKGGDVSFFSNVLSELETLVANNIPYEIVPGVTAASGAAAYAGIPLTARGFASSVRFLTYTHPELIDENQIKELASTEDTLVLYMASKNLQLLLTQLLKNEISEEKWVAVVEQATTPNQKVFSYPVKEFLSATRKIRFRSPSIIVVGKVAKLHQQFDWFKASNSAESFFLTVQPNFLNTAKVA